MEGESRDPKHCSLIGRAAIRNLPEKLPQGWPVEVTYEYQENGRLAVHANVPGTNQSIAIELQNSTGLDSEKVRRWKSVVNADDVDFDAFEEVLDEIVDEKEIANSGGVKTSEWRETKIQPGANSTSVDSGRINSSAGSTTAAKTIAQPTHRSVHIQEQKPTLPNRHRQRELPHQKILLHLRRSLQKLRRSSRLKTETRSSEKILFGAGFLISAFIGLLAGYYVVANINPELGNFLNLPLPGLPPAK